MERPKKFALWEQYCGSIETPHSRPAPTTQQLRVRGPGELPSFDPGSGPAVSCLLVARRETLVGRAKEREIDARGAPSPDSLGISNLLT